MWTDVFRTNVLLHARLLLLFNKLYACNVEPLFDLLTYTDRQTDMMKSIPAFAFVIHVVVVVVVVVVVEIFIHGAVKATVTNAPQSQLNK